MTSPGGSVAGTGSAGLSDSTTGGVPLRGAVVGNSTALPAGADAAAGVVVDIDCGSAGVPAGSVVGAADGVVGGVACGAAEVSAGSVTGGGSVGPSGTTAGGVTVCGVAVGNSGVPLAGAGGVVGVIACGAAGVSAGSVAGASSSGRVSGVSVAAAGIEVSVSGAGGVPTHSHRPLASMPHCQGSAALRDEYSASNETTVSRRMGVYVTTPGNSGRRGRSVLRSCQC